MCEEKVEKRGISDAKVLLNPLLVCNMKCKAQIKEVGKTIFCVFLFF